MHDGFAFLGTGRLSCAPPAPPPSDKLLKLSTSKKINKKIRLHFPLKHSGGDVIVLCFGWYCVERAQAGLPQPGGNQRLRRAGKSGKSGAKCGCYFLAVSRVAESATQSQLFPSRPPPPSSSFSSFRIFSPLIEQSPSGLDRYRTSLPLRRTLLVLVT